MGQTSKLILSEVQEVKKVQAELRDTALRQHGTLERLTATVEVHVKRTDLMEAQIEPIKKHVAMMNGALKLLGLIAVLFPIFEWVWRNHHLQ